MSTDKLRIVSVVDLSGDPSPGEVRARFIEGLRAAILRAHARGDVETQIAEELWRVVPSPEPRR